VGWLTLSTDTWCVHLIFVVCRYSDVRLWSGRVSNCYTHCPWFNSQYWILIEVWSKMPWILVTTNHLIISSYSSNQIIFSLQIKWMHSNCCVLYKYNNNFPFFLFQGLFQSFKNFRDVGWLQVKGMSYCIDVKYCFLVNIITALWIHWFNHRSSCQGSMQYCYYFLTYIMNYYSITISPQMH